MAGVFDVPVPVMSPSSQQSMINAYANSAMAQNALGSVFGGLQTAFGDDNHNASGWYHKKGIMERLGGGISTSRCWFRWIWFFLVCLW